jgi:hypothetical protein
MDIRAVTFEVQGGVIEAGQEDGYVAFHVKIPDDKVGFHVTDLEALRDDIDNVIRFVRMHFMDLEVSR